VVEDVDYKHPRKLDRSVFQTLIAGDWIGAHDNLIISGKTGLGKSWLGGRCPSRDDGWSEFVVPAVPRRAASGKDALQLVPLRLPDPILGEPECSSRREARARECHRSLETWGAASLHAVPAADSTLPCSQPSRTSLRRPLKKRPFLTAAPRVSSMRA